MSIRAVASVLGPPAVLGLLFLALTGGYLTWLEVGDRIFPNVTVGPIPAGGLTGEGLRLSLMGWLDSGQGEDGRPESADIVFRDADTGAAWVVSGVSLGLRVDVEATLDRALAEGRSGSAAARLVGLLLTSARGARVPAAVAVDPGASTAFLSAVAGSVDRPPVNVSLDSRTGAVLPGRPGRRLDVAATVELVPAAVEGRAPGERATVELVIVELPARGSVDRLAALDRELLAAFSTAYDPQDEGRSWNIALASAALDGSVIEPGLALSFNDVVGERSSAAGYRTALEIVDSEMVIGTGGGVCQVATTIFNAALLAGIDVTCRHCHSRPVPYVAPGRDATVAYPGLDLVVKNPGERPVVLTVRASGGRLEAAFWGRREPRVEVALFTEEAARLPAGWTVELREELDPGAYRVVREPGDGREVLLWRSVARDGRVERRELLFTSRYAPLPGLVVMGPPAAPSGSGPDAAPGAPAERRRGRGR